MKKFILSVIALIMCFCSFGQVYQTVTTYGMQNKREKVDSAWHPPYLASKASVLSNIVRPGALMIWSSDSAMYMSLNGTTYGAKIFDSRDTSSRNIASKHYVDSVGASTTYTAGYGIGLTSNVFRLDTATALNHYVKDITLGTPSALFAASSYSFNIGGHTATATLALATQTQYYVLSNTAPAPATPAFVRLDTTFITSFAGKVRSVFSGGLGISYNSSTGQISNSGVLSAFGRTGTVTATSGDYTTDLVTEATNLYWTTTRGLANINSDTGINNTYNLATAGRLYKVRDSLQTQINSNTTSISGKEPTITAGTTAQYWRGDKSWQTLATDVRTEINNDTGRLSYQLATGGSLNKKGDSIVAVLTTVIGTKQALVDTSTYDATKSNLRDSCAAIRATGYRTSSIQIDVYNASTTWNKPTGAKTVRVLAWGGGAGGGAGRRSSTSASGGGGGGGGVCSIVDFDASLLTSSVTVTVGLPGLGAIGQTADNTDGATGGNGNPSSFGAYLRAAGGSGGRGGTNGTTSTTTSAGMFGSYTAGNGNITTTGGAGISSYMTGGSGGAGGGITAGGAAQDAGKGSDQAMSNPSLVGGAGGTSGGAGQLGAAPSTGQYIGGAGGGGGGASITTTGGAGGAGGAPGGAGGGGGASINGQTSGAGGNGAVGMVVVITYF